MIEWRERQYSDGLLSGTIKGVPLFSISRHLSESSSGEYSYHLNSFLPGIVPHSKFDIAQLKEVAEKQFEVWLDRVGLQVRQEMQISVVGLADPAKLASMMENSDE